jgi:hypothetical protein
MLYLADAVDVPVEVESIGPGGEVRVDKRILHVYRDFSDPRRFYYLPANPKVSVFEDGTPAFKLFVFREDFDDLGEDDEEIVGFLALDADVAHPPALIEGAAGVLRSTFELEDDAILTPIPYRDGTARFILLDAQTDPEAEEDDEEPKPTEFVARTLTSGRPSLYGDNRVVFQAELTKKGARAMAGVLAADPDGITPIAVIYELHYAGLQPAYNIKVFAHFKKVYDHFSEREGSTSMFHKEEIERITEELIENRTILVESRIEGVDEEGMIASHDEALSELKKYVIETFFEQPFDSTEPAGANTADQVSDFMVDTAIGLIGAPFSAIFGQSFYQRKEMSVTKERTFEADWTVRKAVMRTIYPQSHLRAYANGKRLTRDDVVVVVDPDELGKVQEIVLVGRTVPWAEDGIAMVAVEVEYGVPGRRPLDTWGAVLTPAQPEVRKRGWLDEDEEAELRVRYVVSFDNTIPGHAMEADSGWVKVDRRVITILPRSLYAVHHLEVAPVPDYPFDRYALVHVAVRYTSTDGSFTFHHDGVLRADQRLYKPSFRVPGGDSTAKVEVKLTHQRNDGVPVAEAWRVLDSRHVVVPDPDVPREVLILPAVNPVDTLQLVVSLRRKEQGVVTDTATVHFAGNPPWLPQKWKFYPEKSTAVRYDYQVMQIMKDGNVVMTDWVGTDAPVLAVGQQLLHTLLVDMTLVGSDPKVTEVEVELAYDRVMPDGTVQTVGGTFALQQAGQHVQWRTPISDPTARLYRYEISWKREDGFGHRIGPIHTADRFLDIPASPPREG